MFDTCVPLYLLHVNFVSDYCDTFGCGQTSLLFGARGRCGGCGGGAWLLCRGHYIHGRNVHVDNTEAGIVGGLPYFEQSF